MFKKGLILSLLVMPSLAQATVIGSYNLRREGFEPNADHQWFLRSPLVKKMVVEHRPAVIGFQEAVKNQIDDLSGGMQDYAWFGTSRGARWFGVLADEAVPLFYDTKQVDALDSGTFFINPGTYWIYDVATKGLCPRICTWGLFKLKDSEKQFYVFNIHLDHLYEQARINGLNKVLEGMAKHVTDHSIPVFLIGDFNTDLTPEISNLLINFKDVRDEAKNVIGPRETSTGFGNKKPATCIDHILMEKSQTILVSNFETVLDPADVNPGQSGEGAYMSDHRAIFATLDL